MSEYSNLNRKIQTHYSEQKFKISGTFTNLTSNFDRTFTRQRILKQENFLSKIPGPIPLSREKTQKLNKCFIPFKALWQNKISNRKIYFSFNNNEKNRKRSYNQTMSLSKLQEMLFSKTNEYNLTIHDAPIIKRKTFNKNHQRLPTQGHESGATNHYLDSKNSQKEFIANHKLGLLNQYNDFKDMDDEHNHNFNQEKFYSLAKFSDSRSSLNIQQKSPKHQQQYQYDEEVKREKNVPVNQCGQRIQRVKSSQRYLGDRKKDICKHNLLNRFSGVQKSHYLFWEKNDRKQQNTNKYNYRTKSSDENILNYLVNNIQKLK